MWHKKSHVPQKPKVVITIVLIAANLARGDLSKTNFKDRGLD